MTELAAPSKTLRQLMATNPSYRGDRLRLLEALYRGGEYLLGDDKIMSQLFPKHRKEEPSVYTERKKRAFYIPYAGEIIDHLVASLFQEPLSMTHTDDSEADDYYKALLVDISPPGGDKCSLNDLIKQQLLECFNKGVAYTLVDMPPQSEYANRAQQEAAGALQAYAVPVCPESVLDWEEEPNGALAWAVVYGEAKRRATPDDDRDSIEKTWTFYTKEWWRRYQLVHKITETPSAETVVPCVASGRHSFGMVPLIRMQFPGGLWAMSKLEGLAKEVLNKVSALSWAQYQHLYQELYEFEFRGDDGTCGTLVGGGSDGASPALTQTRGQGYVQTRDARSRVEFVGPSTDGFEHALKWVQSVRDEMHRVCHQMALSLDNNSAALRRSADSKAHDKASQSVILTAVGQIARAHAEMIFDAISAGRGDSDYVDMWKASGMDAYDAIDVDAAVTRYVELSTVTLHSKTAQVLLEMDLYRAALGEDIGEETYEKIEKELEANIPDEAATAKVLPMDVPPENDSTDEADAEEQASASEAA